jgi:hypothetical protein
MPTNKKNPTAHPAADLFPMLDREELAVLAADIKANGLRQPIVVDSEGRILDGRNRLAACREARVEPAFVTYDGENPDLYILSANVHRRHMSTGARAMATAVVLAINGKRRNGRWVRGSVPAIAGSGSNGWSQRMTEAGIVVDADDPDLCRRVVGGEIALDTAVAMVKPKPVKTSSVDTPAQAAARRRHDTEELEAATVEMEAAVEELEDKVDAVADGHDEKRQGLRLVESHQPKKKTAERRPASRFKADDLRDRDLEALQEIRPLLQAIAALDADLHNGQLRKLTGAPRRRLGEDLARFAVTVRWACDMLTGAGTA